MQLLRNAKRSNTRSQECQSLGDAASPQFVVNLQERKQVSIQSRIQNANRFSKKENFHRNLQVKLLKSISIGTPPCRPMIKLLFSLSFSPGSFRYMGRR